MLIPPSPNPSHQHQPMAHPQSKNQTPAARFRSGNPPGTEEMEQI